MVGSGTIVGTLTIAAATSCPGVWSGQDVEAGGPGQEVPHGVHHRPDGVPHRPQLEAQHPESADEIPADVFPSLLESRMGSGEEARREHNERLGSAGFGSECPVPEVTKKGRGYGHSRECETHAVRQWLTKV